MKYPTLALLLFIAFSAHSQKSNSFRPVTQFTEFIPIPAQDYKGNVVIITKDTTGKTVRDTTTIKILSAFPEYKPELLKFIPHYGMNLTIQQHDKQGKVSFAGNATGHKGESFLLTYDFSAFSTESLLDKGNNAYATIKLGVGIRIKASITVKKNNLNIASLFGLGAEASNKKLSGSLSVEVYGISSPEVISLIPPIAELNISSVQSAVQALAAIKTKIYDSSTSLRPVVLAFKPGDTIQSIDEFMAKYQKGETQSDAIKIDFKSINSTRQIGPFIPPGLQQEVLEKLKQQKGFNG